MTTQITKIEVSRQMRELASSCFVAIALECLLTVVHNVCQLITYHSCIPYKLADGWPFSWTVDLSFH